MDTIAAEVPLTSRLQKEGDLLYYPDARSLLPAGPGCAFGLYARDMRHLSRLEPLLGSARAERRGAVLRIGGSPLRWRTAVAGGGFAARLEWAGDAGTSGLALELAADFRDIFEIRGVHPRLARLPEAPSTGGATCVFGHRGRDGVLRRTLVRCAPEPDGWEVDGALVRARFGSGVRRVDVAAVPWSGLGPPPATPRGFDAALAAERLRQERWTQGCTRVACGDARLADLFARATRDLGTLWSGDRREGLLHAGAPWFAAPFGRDGLIAAWSALTLDPDLLPATLRFLARHQGRRHDPETEEEPGKILHELRQGELAGAGLVPHRPYFGSIDATPLWAAALAEACRWHGDARLAVELGPQLDAALRWCAVWGDTDGDGFIEYRDSASPGRLSNQGWKDSWDGVVRPDGRVPAGPIALVEVQGYHYRALVGAAALYGALGRRDEAARARRAALALARRFAASFWSGGDMPALALDGGKRPVATAASNAGHLLATGPLTPAQARRLSDRLVRPDFRSGWGIRTLAASETAYRPESYHDGSVWPHDTALVVYGLRRRGRAEAAAAVAGDLLAALAAFPEGRIPELFSGQARHPGHPPAPYPGACSLQAWSAASPFLLLRALLGLEPARDGLAVRSPWLPPGVEEMTLTGVRVGPRRFDLRFTARGATGSGAGCPARCEVLAAEGPSEVAVG